MCVKAKESVGVRLQRLIPWLSFALYARVLEQLKLEIHLALALQWRLALGSGTRLEKLQLDSAVSGHLDQRK